MSEKYYNKILESEKDCYGQCFKQKFDDDDTEFINCVYVKKKGSKCKCVLHPCPKCREMYPFTLLDCCEGYCQSCAIEIFGVFGYVKEELGIQELVGKKYLQKFADLMAEFYNYKYD